MRSLIRSLLRNGFAVVLVLVLVSVLACLLYCATWSLNRGVWEVQWIGGSGPAFNQLLRPLAYTESTLHIPTHHKRGDKP